MHYDRVHRGGDPTGRFTAEGDEILTPRADGTCGPGYYIDHGYHGCVPEGTTASWNEDEDAGEGETKGGGYYEPPTGAEEIQLVFSKEIGGHNVRIWTYGLLVRIAVGGESRIFKLPDINQLVLLIDAIKRKYGVL